MVQWETSYFVLDCPQTQAYGVSLGPTVLSENSPLKRHPDRKLYRVIVPIQSRVEMQGQIIGTCNTFCPEEEVIRREKEVHVLEVVNRERRLVKCYSRSAADRNMVVPKHLRPFPVLLKTVIYLLKEVTKRTDVPSPIVYDFINDRLRCVRQDMTIQRLPPGDCAQLLEPMVRFYLYYGHKLCELPIKDYDPVLNQKHLLECIKWYLSCRDDDAKTTGIQSKEVELAGFMSHLDINDEVALINDRILIERLYILCNLGDVHPLMRYLHLNMHLKSNPKLHLAYEIGIENMKGNYIAVCRMIEQLQCPLSYCAMVLYLPTLQRRALQVVSCAYSSKQLSVPLNTLSRWLQGGSAADMATICTHYGVTTDGKGNARFQKDTFKNDAPIMQPKHLLHLQGKHNFTIDYILKC